MSLHVDDFLMAGDDTFRKQVMAKIRKDFQIGPRTRMIVCWLDNGSR